MSSSTTSVSPTTSSTDPIPGELAAAEQKSNIDTAASIAANEVINGNNMAAQTANSVDRA
jgi:hypothetical protein